EERLMEDALRENEERYRLYFESISDILFTTDLNFKILDVSPSIKRILGYEAKDFIGATPTSLKIITVSSLKKALTEVRRVMDGEVITSSELEFVTRNGERKFGELRGAPIYRQGKISGYVFVARETTERNRVETELAAKSKRLEETNTALKVLLRQMEEDKAEMEAVFVENIKKTVLPYVEKLKGIHINTPFDSYVDAMEVNLGNILSPFVHKLNASLAKLTPREIEIANLIKDGRTTKEIAEMLNISPASVDLHRNHIRRKLGLSNSDVNLQHYLSTLI
ncbi:MAG: PAS domain S-box protein, partial [Smithellaceae bacterium]|nr:PAS domain S-box protein [Smithellaceae bacterium]